MANNEIMARLGKQVRDSVLERRNEAMELLNEARDIELAWSKWDLDILVQLRALTEDQANMIRTMRSEHCD